MNSKNLEFYSHPKAIDYLQEIIDRGKHHTYDLEITYPFYRNAKNLIEIGPGYGRCIDFLLKNTNLEKIVGIEFSPLMSEYLKLEYKNEPKVQIIHESILNGVIRDKFDVAIAMFSVFSEFSGEEQKILVQKVYDLLNFGGFFIIDIPKLGFKTFYSALEDDQNVFVPTSFGTLYNYHPKPEDIQSFCQMTGFKRVACMDYLNPADRQRTAYILQKPLTINS